MTDLAEPDMQLRLAGLRDELLRARGYLLHTLGTGAAQPGDDLGESEASTLAEQQAEAALARLRHRRTLSQIDAALERFDDGSYGTCTGCSNPIPVERLEAMPAASRCLDCQYEAEVNRSR